MLSDQFFYHFVYLVDSFHCHSPPPKPKDKFRDLSLCSEFLFAIGAVVHVKIVLSLIISY